MKKFLLIGIWVLGINSLIAQQTYTISISGFTFDPAELTVEIGDTVFFNGSANHPVLEVSLDTWNANATTALVNGFAFPTGVGKVAFDAAGMHYYVCTNHVASSGMKGTILVTTPTSIKSVSGGINFSLYPVPLNGNNLNLKFDKNTSENIDISIYNVIGLELVNLKNQSGRQDLSIDCSNFSKGAYLIRIKQGDRYATSRFIKE